MTNRSWDREAIASLVQVAARAAADKKATDIVALDVASTLVVTDYFVIATGANDRQVHAIAEGIEDALREAGVKPIGREGEAELRWVLLDFGDLVVHVFQPAEREFYRLDRLWADAPRVELPADVQAASGPQTSEGAAGEPGTAE